jgi:Ribbon-helix-helix domain
MTKKHPQEQDREGIVATLRRFSRGRVTDPPGNGGKAYVPPSRKNRKSFTTWQDESALKELRAISHETGISQQTLIAEGLNYVLTKYRKRTVAV